MSEGFVKLILNSKIIRCSLLIVLMSFFYACTNDTVIPVIVTSDIHGTFVPSEENDTSLAAVAGFVNKIRTQNNDLILLDNGDILQGSLSVYYHNHINKDGKHIVSQIMNYLKYDAGTIGNHDIEQGIEVCRRIENEFNFPWMSGNITLNETWMPLFKPFTIINRKGLKIAVLSLTTLVAQKAVKYNEKELVHLKELIPSAKKWIEIIKKDENPDLIIGLFHEGLVFSKPVVENVAGFDLVFVGHDHLENDTVIKSPDGRKVPVLGTSDKGKSVAFAEIKIKKDSKKISGKIVSLEGYEADETFIKFVSSISHDIKNYEKKTVAFSQIPVTDELYLELIHRTLLRITEADISLTAPIVETVSLNPGEISNEDIFKIYPFDNYPVLLNLSGKEINKILKYSNEIAKSEQNNRRFYSALSVNYNVSMPIDENKIYKTAMNSYHASDGGEILSKGAELNSEEIKKRFLKVFDENIRENLFKN